MYQRPPLVDFQKVDPSNRLVYPWFTHPALEWLERQDFSDLNLLEFGAGLGTAWLRSKFKWVDTVETNKAWLDNAQGECDHAGLTNGQLLWSEETSWMRECTKKYHVISVDGIFRDQIMAWALDYFYRTKKEGEYGILIADNFDQDFVWPDPECLPLLEPYKDHRMDFVQPDHTNHNGKPWRTVMWKI